jgi:hypothetical protein
MGPSGPTSEARLTGTKKEEEAMTRKMIPVLLAGLLGAVLLGSCKIDSTTTPIDNPIPPVSPTPQTGGQAADQAEWDSIIWHAYQTPAGKKGAPVKMSLKVTRIDPGSGYTALGKRDPNFKEAVVYYEYSTPPWSGGDPARGFDGIMQHFFWWNADAGAWEGGGFEWWETRVGGRCGMINAQDFINRLRVPVNGNKTKVAFAWTKFDGSERSNLAKFVWP